MSGESQFCTFTVGGFLFGIEVSHIQEVMRYHEMTEVPLSADVVQGLINLRGQIITALDLRRKLKMPEPEEGQLPMNVVVRVHGEVASLLVDGIGDVMTVSEEIREPPPDTVDPYLKLFLKDVYKLKNRLLLILDVKKLLDVE